MARRGILTLAVLLIVAGGLGWWFWQAEARGDSDSLRLYGNVDIRQVNLSFNAEGRLEAVLVDEGDRVQAGQPVARLDRSYHEDARRIAEARTAAQRAVLNKLESGSRPEEIALARAQLAEADATLSNTRATLRRQEDLARRSVASQQELDNARTAVQEAEARLNARRENLNLVLAGPRQEDIAAARAQLAADEALLALADRRLADTVLSAPDDGTILNRVLEPGALTVPGGTVLTLAIDRPVWVRTYVAEPDLGRIPPGTAVTVTTDGGHAYQGRIGYVSPTAEFTPRAVETPDLRTSLVYRVRVIIAEPDQALRQGMPVTVTVAPTPPPARQPAPTAPAQG